MTIFVVDEIAPEVDNNLSVSFCLEEEESVAKTQGKKTPISASLPPWLMVILGVIGLLYTAGKGYFEGRSTSRQLDTIETSLRVLTQTIAAQIYQSIDDSLRSALTQNGSDSAKSLANAQAEMKQLQDAKVRVDAKQLMQSGAVLANVTVAHPELGEVWATSGQLISYRSQSSATAPPSNQANCATEAGAGPSTLLPGPPVRFFLVHYLNCTLVIDDEASFRMGPAYQQYLRVRQEFPNEYVALGLHRVHVVYRGGAVIGTAFMLFDNCTFEFQVPKIVPPDDGMKLVRGLLYADLDQPTTVKFVPGI